MAAPPLLLPSGAVLLRLRATARTWCEHLPQLPAGTEVTVTLGRPELLPLDTGAVRDRGYRIIGAASAHRPIGDVIDLLLTEELRRHAPEVCDALFARAERVFDLSLGPVQRMLHAELSVHARAMTVEE